MQYQYSIPIGQGQALVDLFNPKTNKLKAQSQGVICRVNAILHELSEPVAFGINDTSLHCIMPIVIYGRKQGLDDEFLVCQINL